MVVYDAEGLVTYANDAFVGAYGWSFEELAKKRIGFVPLDQEEKSAQAWRETLATGRAQFETRRLTKGGNLIDVDIRATSLHGPGGEFTGSVVIHRNVTERKKAELALARSEEQYRKTLESMPVAVWIANAQGRLEYANQAAVRLFRAQSAADLVGRDYLELVIPEERRASGARIRRMREGGGGVPSRRHHILALDGSVVEVESMGSSFDFQGHQVMQGVAQGMSERNRVEMEKAALEAQLRQAQKMEAVGTLAGGVAHDFNNILAAIMGYSELALDSMRVGADCREEIGQVIAAAERARALVRQILTFSRRLEVQARPLDLNRRLGQILDLLNHTLPKMVDIEAQFEEGLKPINADPNQIEQVVLNLASNANDAMPGGGRLLISTKSVVLDQDDCQKRVGLEPGEYALLIVSDTGQGIDEATRAQIFDPFFTTKGPGKGTGLGLSTVYGIVKGHNGYIECESSSGRGTAFKIYFPTLSVSVKEDVEPSAAGALGQSKGETILMADDEQPIRHMVSEILKRKGYKVLTAKNGEEALEIYREKGDEIDLTLLDLGMPGMGGQRCAQSILAGSPQAKILIASGYSSENQVQQCMEQGASGFVAKPYRTADLIRAIRGALDSA